MATPKKTTQVEYLPAATVNALHSLKLKGFHQANAVQIIAAVLRLCERENDTLEDYKTIASAYFECISDNYSPALKVLKQAGIIQVYTSKTGKQYSTAAGVAKAYRVNPELVDKRDEAVEFTVKTDVVRCANLDPQMATWITQDLLGLEINALEARADAAFYLEHLTFDKWEVTTKSPEYTQNGYSNDVRFGTSPTQYKYRIQTILDEVLKKPENAHLRLFHRGEGYTITTAQEFLKRKKAALARAWYRSINTVERQQYFAKKVDINNRVHTTLTEYSKERLNHVTWRGQELLEVDVRNSQLAALAHVMVHGDVLGEGINFPILISCAGSRAFLRACQTGTIYDDLGGHLGLLRHQAKDEMFRTLFGGVNKGSLTWKKITQQFGQISSWLETVKGLVVSHDEKGEPQKFNLATYLQRLEAQIMIEHVYVALKQAGIVAFSKHDSYLVPEAQVAQAQAIVEVVFTDLGYAATLKNKLYRTTPTPMQPQDLTPNITTTDAWLAELLLGTISYAAVAQQFLAKEASCQEEQLNILNLSIL